MFVQDKRVCLDLTRQFGASVRTFIAGIYSVSRGADWNGTAPCSGLQVCVSAGSDEVRLTR